MKGGVRQDLVLSLLLFAIVMNALNNDVVKTIKDFFYPRIYSFLEITEKKWKKSMLNGKGK